MSLELRSRGKTEISISGGSATERTLSNGATVAMETVGGAPGPRGQDAATVDLEFIAAEAIGGHRAVAINGAGEAILADPETLAGNLPAGISVGAAAQGDIVIVRPTGMLEEMGWNWNAGPVWLGPNGGLQQVPPVAGCVILMGSAAGPTRLRIAPQIVAASY